MNEQLSFQRYLKAKKTVDDRSLNRMVLDRLRAELPEQGNDTLLQVLEVGAGIGTMFERLAEWDLLANVHYTAIDLDLENIRTAREYLAEWGERNLWRVSHSDRGILFEHGSRRMELYLEVISLDDFIKNTLSTETRWDLLIAHAFLDLIDMPNTLPGLLSMLSEGGLYYFTLNFDGVTILEPGVNPVLDELIVTLYHRSMDERSMNGHKYGDSQTGRHLFQYLGLSGSELLAAGASDWIVYPISGRYLADEGYFLNYIIHTIHQELSNHPDLGRNEFVSWIEKRHTQVDRGELVFIAHQLDFLGRTKVTEGK